MLARRSACNRSRSYSADCPIFEPLEERRLLTTLYGGQSFTYRDVLGDHYRITLGGNIEAEFVGARINRNIISQPLRADNLVSAGAPDDVDGIDLFAIYVTRATPQSYISIVQVDDNGVPTPFGDPADLNVRPANLVPTESGFITISGADNSGSGYLGARTVNLDGTDIPQEENRPILAMGLPAGGFGVIPPQPGNILRAGLIVANGATLGRFIFDGTVSGFVNVTGSIGDFYAGNLFTGDTRGQTSTDQPTYADNFNVAGDVRNILIKGFVGTDESATTILPTYWTGFDLQVRGTLAQFRAANHIGGLFDVRNAADGPFLTTPQRETEYKTVLGGGLAVAPLAFGELGGDEFFENDSFDRPQYLASISDPLFAGAHAVRVTGSVSLLSDPTDFYALPLLAGQTVWVQVASPLGLSSSPLVGVFDPDGRHIASNYNDIDPAQTVGRIFQFTADRPGFYRFAVGTQDTGLFGQGGLSVISPNYGEYSLRIQFGGNIPLGAVVSDEGNYVHLASRSGIKVWRGDFGGLQVGDSVISAFSSGATPDSVIATVDVPFANLRVVRGGNLGLEADERASGLSVNAPFGHVGLIQSTVGTIGLNLFQGVPVGGNFQIIDAATDLFGVISTRRAIGIIRAGTVLGGTEITVNADDIGRDGEISLIDVTGDFGSGGIGPRITTNLGGNVGYVRVGGEVFRDPRFGTGGGTGGGNTIIVPAGQSLNITDDSGAIINIGPRLIPNPRYIPGFVNPLDPTDIRMQPYLGKAADFTVTTFPVFGSGGSVVVEVIADRSLVLSSINPSRDGRHVEIGRIEFTEAGHEVVFNPIIQPGTGTGDENPPVIVDDTPALDTSFEVPEISLYVQGPTPISVLETSFGSAGELPGDAVRNVSGGEMPIVRAGSLGSIYASNVGTARQTAGGTALLPIEILLDAYPFIGERTGVVVGNIVSVIAPAQIGNVSASGVIGTILPNSDNIDQLDVFEGIVGTIQAGDMRYVDIGEGIASGGTGFDNQAGLFSNGPIRIVTNRGRGDIRGPVVSLTKLNRIELTNGSIINANIGVVGSFEEISDYSSLVSLPSGEDPINNPGYEVGPIVLRGNGGIIGSYVFGHDIEAIRVHDGFGIFNSVVASNGVGRIGQILAGGYGIRRVVVTGGGSVTELNATGDGRQLNSALYSPQVRLSEFYQVDPFFGFQPNEVTDLHAMLGTSASNRFIDNVTNSGIIEDTLAEGLLDLNRVFAQRLRRSVFNFADRIDLIQTRGPVRLLSVTTGRLGPMYVNGDMAQTTLNVAGPINDVYVTGSVDADTLIQAVGASGRIGRFQTLGFLAGDIRTTGVMDVLAVGRDILSSSRIEADEITTRFIAGQVFGEIVIT